MKSSEKQTLGTIVGKLAITLFATAIAIGAGPAFAGGGNFHFYVGQQAVEKKLPNGYLQTLILNNYDAYKLGLLFPDLPNAIRDTDESDRKKKEHRTAMYLHSPQFLNDYAAAIVAQCANIGQEKCDEVKAHYFGVIGHDTFDTNFDTNFVKQVQSECNYEELGPATIMTDQTIDRAAFNTIPRGVLGIRKPFVIRKVPPTSVYKKAREARRQVIKDNAVARVKNEGLEKQARDARRALWNKTRPREKRPYPITFLSANVLTDSRLVDFGTRDISKNMKRALDAQWILNVKGQAVGRSIGKGPPHTAVSYTAQTKARKQCAWGLKYGNWGMSISNTAYFLAEFMQMAWTSLEQGQTPHFRGKKWFVKNKDGEGDADGLEWEDIPELGETGWKRQLCYGEFCTPHDTSIKYNNRPPDWGT